MTSLLGAAALTAVLICAGFGDYAVAAPAHSVRDTDALVYFARRGDLEAVKARLSRASAAALNGRSGRDQRGDMPLYAAASRGHAAIVEAMLAKGADPNSTSSIQRDESSGTPALVIAAWRGDAVVASLLIDAGANVDLPSPRYRVTALLTAVRRNNVTIARMLLDGGADPMVPALDGQTAYAFARRNAASRPEIYKLIMSRLSGTPPEGT